RSVEPETVIPVHTPPPPCRPLAPHTLSRLPEQCNRAHCRMVPAVGLTIRDVGPSRSLGLQSRFLDIYSGKSIERLSEPLSRSLRSGRKSRGFGKRRRPVHRALRAHGRRTLARLD